jgi:hypothetical protein
MWWKGARGRRVDTAGMMDGMHGAYRSLVVLIGCFVIMVLVTISLALMLIGPRPVGEQPGTGGSPSLDPSGVGGTLRFAGDHNGTLVLDREVLGEPHAAIGRDGRIEFVGQPAGVDRLQIDGLDFFLDPEDCAVLPGSRVDDSGLVPVEVNCAEISDVREQVLVTVDGTLHLSGQGFGVRGDAPPTGGSLAVGAETLAFTAVTLDLRQPRILFHPGGRTERDPLTYPVTVVGNGGTLHFEYGLLTQELELLEVELASGITGTPEVECQPTFRRIDALNPHVTVVEMALDCPALALDGSGSMPVAGTLTADVMDFPDGLNR